MVDETITTAIKDVDQVRRMIQHSVNTLRKEPEYETVRAKNFQQVLGGRVELLLGQNVRDFFPEHVKELDGGLIITKMRVNLLDEERYLGFAGTFPAQFDPIYQRDEHPKTLAIEGNQEQAEHEDSQVFQKAASVSHLSGIQL